MPRGRGRDELIARVARFRDNGFQDQVLPFNHACAVLYGEIRSAREATGTAQDYGVQAIVTRETKDFIGRGVKLIDPWRTT
jgi:toxin FitB